MNLNNHIVANDISKPFHNSGFAEVANGDHFGSTSNISFDQRLQIDRNRQIIASYQRSTLGNTYGAQRVKPVIRHGVNRVNMPQRPSLQQRNSYGSAPRHFKEPSARRFDPYA